MVLCMERGARAPRVAGVRRLRLILAGGLPSTTTGRGVGGQAGHRAPLVGSHVLALRPARAARPAARAGRTRRESTLTLGLRDEDYSEPKNRVWYTNAIELPARLHLIEGYLPHQDQSPIMQIGTSCSELSQAS